MQILQVKFTQNTDKKWMTFLLQMLHSWREIATIMQNDCGHLLSLIVWTGMYCICACMHSVLQMTSSSPQIYSRGIWATSGSSCARELGWCLLASFTYNNIQVHSPVPNTHTQTIHRMLNSISLRGRLCTSACVCMCCWRGWREGKVPIKTHVIFRRVTLLWGAEMLHNGFVAQN